MLGLFTWQNLVFTLYAHNKPIGTGNVEKRHLHDEVYGFDARTDIFQAQEKIGTLSCKKTVQTNKKSSKKINKMK